MKRRGFFPPPSPPLPFPLPSPPLEGMLVHRKWPTPDLPDSYPVPSYNREWKDVRVKWLPKSTTQLSGQGWELDILIRSTPFPLAHRAPFNQEGTCNIISRRMTRYFESNNNLRDRGQDFPRIQSPNVMLSWCLTKRLFAEAKDDITFIPHRVNKLTWWLSRQISLPC